MVNAASKKRPRENSLSSEESENEYQVEAIVDKRFKANKNSISSQMERLFTCR